MPRAMKYTGVRLSEYAVYRGVYACCLSKFSKLMIGSFEKVLFPNCAWEMEVVSKNKTINFFMLWLKYIFYFLVAV